MAKLGPARARQLREFRAGGGGRDLAEVAEAFGVDLSTVSLVCTGKLYASAGGPLTRAETTQDDEAREIRERKAAGESVAELAQAYVKPESTIRNIVFARTHKSAGGPVAQARSYSRKAPRDERAPLP